MTTEHDEGPAGNGASKRTANDASSITDGGVHYPADAAWADNFARAAFAAACDGARRGLRLRTADAALRANFERMAERAAADAGFYEIAGSGVQARADQIRAGWSA